MISQKDKVPDDWMDKGDNISDVDDALSKNNEISLPNTEDKSNDLTEFCPR